MQITSVNAAQPEPLHLGGDVVTTAIRKRPLAGPATVGPLGIEGDGVGSPRHHGGPDQAVYLYTSSDYDHWADRLPIDMEPGLFGENVTVATELSSAHVWVGDRFVSGEVVLEATAPRIPCRTFAARLGQPPDFIAEFRAALRPGVYTRVIAGGRLEVGAGISVEPGERTVRLTEMVDAWGSDLDLDTLERFLAAPIAIRDREVYARARERLVD